jgi:uncharacterized protein
MIRECAPRILWAPSCERAEEDCACSVAGPLPGGVPGIASALWQISSRLYRAPLPEAHKLAFNPASPAGVVVLNEPAHSLLDTYAVPRPLTNAAARRLAALGLLLPVCDGGVELQPAQPYVLTAWLHVTGQCNLRCAYCYAPSSDEAMDLKIGHAAVDTVFRSALANGFRAVKLKYAGGEPTLNWSLVRVLHERAKALATQYGLELHAVVLSNGTTLTDEIVDWLRGEGIRLMISLDGIGAAHDAQRPFADGRGSFAQVARNVDRALARGLFPHLSITVTACNADGLADTVAFVLERDLLFNLNFVRELGIGTHELQADHARLIAGVKSAFAVIEAALPRRRLIDALVDRGAFGMPHQYPCGAGRNYLVIGPQGRVARCQMTMDHPVADVWADDPLQAVREWRGGFQNISVDEKEGCQDCIWRYWCAGGCPLLAWRTTGRSGVPSPYCAVYKALYPDVLRLEGLRLLKWQLPSN